MSYTYFISISNPWYLTTFVYRRLMILEDQYKTAVEELEEKKEKLKAIRPPTAKMNKDTHKIKLLENQLEKALVKYNEVQSFNKKLR